MKKKIIALLAGATAVATVGGSFAAWDVLGSKESTTLIFDTPIKVTANVVAGSVTGGSDTAMPTGSAVFKFDVEGAVGKNIELTHSLKDGGNQVESTLYTITIYDGEANTSQTINNNVDSTVGTANSYLVEITPNNTDEARAAFGGKTLTIELEATLIDGNNP